MTYIKFKIFIFFCHEIPPTYVGSFSIIINSLLSINLYPAVRPAGPAPIIRMSVLSFFHFISLNLLITWFILILFIPLDYIAGYSFYCVLETIFL